MVPLHSKGHVQKVAKLSSLRLNLIESLKNKEYKSAVSVYLRVQMIPSTKHTVMTVPSFGLIPQLHIAITFSWRDWLYLPCS